MVEKNIGNKNQRNMSHPEFLRRKHPHGSFFSSKRALALAKPELI